uniref:Uncharacterized protein n=1 Tax=Sinocyclocheilus rhinocerous TaxID=307959 RepID=A0A673IM18_9TELE
MISSRSQMADTIKTEMASFRSEIGLIVENLRSEVKTKMDALQLEIAGQIHSILSKPVCLTLWRKWKQHSTLATTRSRQWKPHRSQNLRIIGIPEDAEKGRPTDFMSGFFSEVLGEDLPDLQSVVLDRALAPKPCAGDRPRAMIVRLHYFSDKAKILQASRKRGELTFRGARKSYAFENVEGVFFILIWGAVWWVGRGHGVRLAFKLVHVYLCYCVQLETSQKEAGISFSPIKQCYKPGT